MTTYWILQKKKEKTKMSNNIVRHEDIFGRQLDVDKTKLQNKSKEHNVCMPIGMH